MNNNPLKPQLNLAITNKISSLKDVIVNKFIPNWKCTGKDNEGHPELWNDTYTCKYCEQKIWNSKESYKLWKNLNLFLFSLIILSIPLGILLFFFSLKQEIRQQGMVIQEQETTIQKQEQDINNKAQLIQEQKQDIQTKSELIQIQKQDIQTKSELIQIQKQDINKKNGIIKNQNQLIKKNNIEIKNMRQQIKERDIKINNLQKINKEQEFEINKMKKN